MISSSQKSWINKRIEAWTAKRAPGGTEAVLNRGNILIIPTAQGFLFATVSLVIFIAAINYENSLAFGLAFLMVSLFVVCMFHTFNNLNGLRLTVLPANPVFCGEDAAFQVLLSRGEKRSHEALEAYFSGSTIAKAELVTYHQEPVAVFRRATQRGDFQPPCLYIRSRFPTGLFTAWSVVHLSMHCLVYPKPAPVSLGQLFNSGVTVDESALVREGTEDFHGFRSFVPGDSLKQVAWKNVARGQGMLVKQFVDYIDERRWLDWDMFYGFPDEERLSRLCYCTLKLAGSGVSYGLRLPGLEIAPATGKQHRLRILQALALYQGRAELPGAENGRTG